MVTTVKDGLSYTSQHHAPRSVDTEASQEGAVRRDRKGGQRDAQDVGWRNGRRRDNGGERLSPVCA